MNKLNKKLSIALIKTWVNPMKQPLLSGLR